MKPLLIKIFLTTSLAISLIVAGYLLTCTPTGLRYSMFVIAKLIPGKLETQQLTGKLIGPIHATNIKYRHNNLQVEAEQLTLDWQLSALWRQKIHIQNLIANNITITSTEISPKPHNKWHRHPNNIATFLSALPNLQLDQIQLTNIKWKNPLTTSIIENISLLDTTINSRKFIINAEATANKSHFIIQGGLDREWKLIWQIDIAEIERFIPQIYGTLKNHGTIIGPRTKPTITSELTATRLQFANNSCSKLHSQLILNAATKTAATAVTLAVEKLKIGTLTIPKLNLTGGTTPTNTDGSMYLTISPTTLSYMVNQRLQYLPIDRGNIKFLKKTTSLTIDLFLQSLGRNTLNLSLLLPNYKITAFQPNTQAITGKIACHTNDLAVIASIIPTIQNVIGKLSVKFDITGTLKQPKFTGIMSLTDASFAIKDIALQPHLNVTGTCQNNNLEYYGKMTSGNGILDLKGHTIIQYPDFPTDITAKGTDVLVANTDEYKITASPQVQLNNKKHYLEIKGKAFIPMAKIQPHATNNVDLPNELTIVQHHKTQSNIPKVHSEIYLTLGDNILLNASGLTGKLFGQLQLIDETEHPTIAYGTLTLKNGGYSIYGQPLEISHGSIQYAGNSIDNPRLHIQATRKFKANNITFTSTFQYQDLTVGLQMQGFVDNLQTNLYSIPAGLSKSDILSYLILGQSTEQAADTKIQLLLKSASALNLSGVGELNNVVNRLQQRLGFSEFGLAMETQNHNKEASITPPKLIPTPNQPDKIATNTAFVLGRYLNPKIYISYSMGLIDTINIFRMRYLINDKWSLQSEASIFGSGIDVLYSLEN